MHDDTGIEHLNLLAYFFRYSFFFLNEDLFPTDRRASAVKLRALQHYLDLGFDWVMYTDVDFVFYGYFLPYLNLILQTWIKNWRIFYLRGTLEKILWLAPNVHGPNSLPN